LGPSVFLVALYFRSDIASYIGETLTTGLMFGLFILFCGLPALELIDGWRFVRNSERHEREQEAENKRQQTEWEREEQEQKAEWNAFKNWRNKIRRQPKGSCGPLKMSNLKTRNTAHGLQSGVKPKDRA
jgi:hypothetical protein